jgi:endonuclease/exonuclease/phosphatase family metal-dependent hydrolase
VALINPGHLPVVFGGDLNAWQNNQQGDRPHDALVSAGYFDTAAAATQYNVRWTTYNGFATTIPSNPSGWGARLDVIAVKGISSASRFENMMLRVQTHRASDHNMVVADIRLP